MRMTLLACLLLPLAGAANAQLTAGNTGSAYATTPATSGAGNDLPAKPADEGRFTPNDRDGLSGRGGRTATDRTYQATIGTPMGGTIGSTIGASLPLSR